MLAVMSKTRYTAAEAASAAGRSIWTIYRWARQGRLEAFRTASGALLIPALEIEKIIALRPYSEARKPKVEEAQK
jgi:predicted site-specific integrase-resolvase